MRGKRARQVRRYTVQRGTSWNVYRQMKRLIRGRKRLAVIRAMSGE